MKLLLIGNFQPGHIGRSLHVAACRLNAETRTADTRNAFASMRWVNRLSWHIRDHRPALIERFSASVIGACQEFEPTFLLSTGCAPISATAIRQVSEQGVICLNYSTDDPWSESHRSAWFLEALSTYAVVYTPRRSNLPQLRQLHGPDIEYLPFGYDPEIYHPSALETEERDGISCDVLFVGGGDRDRFPLIEHLIRHNFDLGLYGANWDRNSHTRKITRGHATPDLIRRATNAAKVNLCLIRRSNRDGHVMRSFEAAAMGACLLVEATAEHRQLFGEEGQSVVYFDSIGEMVDKLSWLLEHPDQRRMLGRSVMERITNGGNTYQDRLATMLSHAGARGKLTSRS